jgi:hypothetical protein
VDGSDGEFVFVDGGDGQDVLVNGSHRELVDVDGSDGQVVTLGLESGVISGPGQSEFLAFRGNPVGRSFVGISVNLLGVFFAVIIDGGDDEFLLFLGLVTGRVVRLGVAVFLNFIFISDFISRQLINSKRKKKLDVPPLAAAVQVALVRLAGDGNLGIFVVLLVRLLVRCVTGRSGGGDGQDSGDDELSFYRTG